MNIVANSPRFYFGALLALTLASSSAMGFEVSTKLPRPDQLRGGLVQPRKFSLPTARLSASTRIVVFFYTASWCVPCKKIGAALRETYADFRLQAPGLQIITYSVDHSPGARARYLREEAFPWPAIGPAVIDNPPWLTTTPGGTPQFQAFSVAANHLEAVTPPGPANEVISAALAFLRETARP